MEIHLPGFVNVESTAQEVAKPNNTRSREEMRLIIIKSDNIIMKEK